jgi:O-antigen/teichoic acid export membrane protein
MLSLIFPLSALSVVPQALLQKRLNFRQISLRQCLGEIGFGLVSLGLALRGFGVWSLAVGAIVRVLICSLTLLLSTEWRLQFSFSWTECRQLFRFGGLSLVGTLINQGTLNLGYFMVGHWQGTEALGYFTLAYQLAIFPQQRLAGMIRRVAFPVLALLQNDTNRLKKVFLESFQYVFATLLPLSLLIALVGPLFVKIAYSPQWLPMIRPLQLMAVIGLFYSIDYAEALYLAVGKPGIRFKINLMRLLLFALVASVYGVHHGIFGVSMSLLFSVVLTGIVVGWQISHLVNLPPIELLQAIGPLSLAGGIAALPVLLPSVLRVEVQATWRLCVVMTIGILGLYIMGLIPVYWTQLYAFSHRVEFHRFIWKRKV